MSAARSMPEPRLPDRRGGPSLGWGIVGPGFIAGEFVAAIQRWTNQRVVAVSSRALDRAEAFARLHGIPRAHEGVAALANDPSVDIVYIAGPHSSHVPLAIECIAAGKPVLIEKPLALSADGARAVAQASRDSGVLAMEAMWSRYLPRTRLVAELLANGMLGELKLVIAEIGAVFDQSSTHRSQDPRLGGGALADLGVYPLWFSRFALGPLRLRSAWGTRSPTGVDDQAGLVIEGQNESLAMLSVSMRTGLSNRATIAGTAGRIELDGPFFIPGGLRFVSAGTEIEWADPSGMVGNAGLAWQAVEAARLIGSGVVDAPDHPMSEVVEVLATIDEARAILRAVPYAPGL